MICLLGRKNARIRTFMGCSKDLPRSKGLELDTATAQLFERINQLRVQLDELIILHAQNQPNWDGRLEGLIEQVLALYDELTEYERVQLRSIRDSTDGRSTSVADLKVRFLSQNWLAISNLILRLIDARSLSIDGSQRLLLARCAAKAESFLVRVKRPSRQLDPAARQRLGGAPIQAAFWSGRRMAA